MRDTRWWLALVVSFLSALSLAPAETPTAVATLEGRIVGPEGQPLLGAVVYAVAESGGKSSEVTAPASGAFRLELQGDPPFVLRAEAQGMAPLVLRGLKPGDPLQVQLRSGWSGGGAVLDKVAGRPLPDLEVLACPTTNDVFAFAPPLAEDRFCAHARTDDQGRFQFSHLMDGALHLLEIRAPTHTSGGPISLAPPAGGEAAAPLLVYLAPGAVISGTVNGPDGKPVEKAKVWAVPDQLNPADVMRWPTDPKSQAMRETDAQGRFELRSLPLASSYTLTANARAFARTWVSGVTPGKSRSATGVSIVMQRGGTLNLRLLDPGGKPFRGDVSYAVLCPGGTNLVNQRTSEGELKEDEIVDGRLAIADLPPCQARVTIQPVNFAPVTQKQVALTSGRATDLGEIKLQVGPRISGRVLDSSGQPVTAGMVMAQAFSLTSSDRRVAPIAKDGAFVLAGLNPALEYLVNVEASGFGSARKANVKPDGEPLEIRLPKAGRIHGRVASGQPPRPVAEFVVVVSPVDQDSPLPLPIGGLADRRETMRAATGEFTIKNANPGKHALRIEARGLIPRNIDAVEVGEGQTVELGDLMLDPGAILSGLVIEKATRAPVAGAVFHIEGAGAISVAPIPGAQPEAGQTGLDGRFSIGGLAPGEQTLAVEAPNLAPQRVSITVAAGQPLADIVVELGAGGALEGVVRDPAGQPLADNIVLAMGSLTADLRLTASTDAQGRYRIERIPPGAFRVMAMRMPGNQDEGGPAGVLDSMQMATVEIVEGRTTYQNFPQQTGLRLSGIVRRGKQPVEAKIFLGPTQGGKPTGESVVTGSSDASGKYELRLPGPGAYRGALVQLVEGQVAPKTRMIEVTVPAGQTELQQDLVLPENLLAGRVVNSLTGEAIPGANVVALRENAAGEASTDDVMGTVPSGPDGGFELESLQAGRYQLIVSKPGFGPAIMEKIKLGSDTREDRLFLALTPAIPFTVKVLDDQGGPIEGAIVVAMDSPALLAAGVLGTTSSGGQFQMQQLGVGSHALAALARGFAPALKRDLLLEADRPNDVVIRLERGGAATIKVVNSNDAPEAGATIEVALADGTDLTALFQLLAMTQGQTLTTDRAGVVTLPHLVREPLDLTVRAGERRGTAKIKVKPGETAETTVRLP